MVLLGNRRPALHSTRIAAMRVVLSLLILQNVQVLFTAASPEAPELQRAQADSGTAGDHNQQFQQLQGSSGRDLLSSIQPPSYPPPMPPPHTPPAGPSPPPVPPPTTISVMNEAELADAISKALGPGTTIVLLPSNLTLTQSLPPVSGPLELSSSTGGSRAVVACDANVATFTVFQLSPHSFTTRGLAWIGCGSVMNISSATQVAITDCSFQGAASLYPATVSACIMILVMYCQEMFECSSTDSIVE